MRILRFSCFIMNKTHVIEHLRFALESQLHRAKEAAKAAHDAATHEESVAETQYDTLGLEAAYLAQGQAERVNECYRDIQAFNTVFKETEFPKVREGHWSLLLMIKTSKNGSLLVQVLWLISHS